MKLPTVTQVKAKLAGARKAIVGVAGVAGQLLALGVLHGTAQHVAQVVVAVATAAGVYGVGNRRP